MTTNIATTKEQSARLLQCGVDPETADMYYQVPITLSQKQRGEDILLLKRPGKTLYNIDAPAWSLSAMLGLLPKEIEDYHLSIESFKETHYVAYIRDSYDDYLIPHKDAPELIDALYSLLVWCLEKGYVKLD